MPWIIRLDDSSKGKVVFNKEMSRLETSNGCFIADICVNKQDRLWMSLGMNTYYEDNDGNRGVGFNGCEEHIATHVWRTEGWCDLIFAVTEHYKTLVRIKVRIEYLAVEDNIVLPVQMDSTTFKGRLAQRLLKVVNG